MLKNSLSVMLDFWEAYERGIQKISWGDQPICQLGSVRRPQPV